MTPDPEKQKLTVAEQVEVEDQLAEISRIHKIGTVCDRCHKPFTKDSVRMGCGKRVYCEKCVHEMQLEYIHSVDEKIRGSR